MDDFREKPSAGAGPGADSACELRRARDSSTICSRCTKLRGDGRVRHEAAGRRAGEATVGVGR